MRFLPLILCLLLFIACSNQKKITRRREIAEKSSTGKNDTDNEQETSAGQSNGKDGQSQPLSQRKSDESEDDNQKNGDDSNQNEKSLLQWINKLRRRNRKGDSSSSSSSSSEEDSFESKWSPFSGLRWDSKDFEKEMDKAADQFEKMMEGRGKQMEKAADIFEKWMEGDEWEKEMERAADLFEKVMTGFMEEIENPSTGDQISDSEEFKIRHRGENRHGSINGDCDDMFGCSWPFNMFEGSRSSESKDSKEYGERMGEFTRKLFQGSRKLLNMFFGASEE